MDYKTVTCQPQVLQCPEAMVRFPIEILEFLKNFNFWEKMGNSLSAPIEDENLKRTRFCFATSFQMKYIKCIWIYKSNDIKIPWSWTAGGLTYVSNSIQVSPKFSRKHLKSSEYFPILIKIKNHRTDYFRDCQYRTDVSKKAGRTRLVIFFWDF